MMVSNPVDDRHDFTGSVWIGLLAGIAASLALSAIHGLASITFRGNQLISGVALNFLACRNKPLHYEA